MFLSEIFSDLAKFVQESADVANNMFGQHLSATQTKDKGSKVKQRNRPNEVPSQRVTTLAVRGNQNSRENTQRQETSTFRLAKSECFS